MSYKVIPKISTQSGIASILVTMIIMIVLSLIVIGFSTVSRREQTDALNSQLGTQAFYASETGINDAWSNMNQQLATTGQIQQKTTCGADPAPGSPYNAMTGQVDNATNVKYTCLLISTVLPNINVDVTSGVTLPLHFVTRSGTDVKNNNTINFAWHPTSGTTTTAGCTGAGAINILPTSTSCRFSTLEVELVPINPNGTPLTRGNLTDDEITTYLVPTTSGATGTVNYGHCDPAAPANVCGQIVAGGCASGTCQAHITALGGQDTAYYELRLKALYDTANVVISPGSSNTLISGAEAQVDSTGQANDVLRRVQVRFSLADNNLTPLPTAGLQTTQSICKRYQVAPGVFQVGSGVPAADAANCGMTNPPGASNADLAQCVGPTKPNYCPAPDPGLKDHPGQPVQFFNVTLYNLSNNPGLQIAGCQWNWGDSRDSNNIQPDVDCAYTQSNTHCYQVALAADQAEINTVTLTMYFKNAPPATDKFVVSIPHAPTTTYADNPPCALPVS